MPRDHLDMQDDDEEEDEDDEEDTTSRRTTRRTTRTRTTRTTTNKGEEKNKDDEEDADCESRPLMSEFASDVADAFKTGVAYRNSCDKYWSTTVAKIVRRYFPTHKDFDDHKDVTILPAVKIAVITSTCNDIEKGLLEMISSEKFLYYIYQVGHSAASSPLAYFLGCRFGRGKAASPSLRASFGFRRDARSGGT